MPNKLDFLDEIRAIAQMGIYYTKDQYNLDRYFRLMELVSAQYSDLTGLPTDEIKNRFTQELGYITPKVGVQGALINAEGEILLDRRADDGCWGLPAGWVEVHESPEEAIVREFKEETGFTIEIQKLVKIYTRKPGKFNQPHGSIHLLYLCNYMNGELKKSFESHELKFIKIEESLNLSPWHNDHKMQVEEVFGWVKKLKESKI